MQGMLNKRIRGIPLTPYRLMAAGLFLAGVPVRPVGLSALEQGIFEGV